MTSSRQSIKVTSHVGRDLLAAASSFKTEGPVTWEYVVNSLQYVDEGVLPKVQVTVSPRQRVIEIRDNGRGMTADQLEHFFRMHGENVDRLKGRPGRGKFGTGKSAAFGIANTLVVDTRRNRLRNTAKLTREAIDASSGRDIEVAWDVRDEQTGEPNGTTVTIARVFLPTIRIEPIVEHIERHLLTYRSCLPEVAVNGHLCTHREPRIAEEFTFSPTGHQAETIGDVKLTIKVSQVPLPLPAQGVAVTAGLANLVAIETGGIETKEMGNYLFGDVDVSTLESTKAPMEPYDVTRSLQLNPQHPVSRVLLSFIGARLEEVRKLQVAKLREAQRTEEARRLTTEAQRIAEILNRDFSRVMGRLDSIRSAAARPGNLSSAFGNPSEVGSEPGGYVEGTAEPGIIESSSAKAGSSALSPGGQPEPQIARAGLQDESGEASVDPAGGLGKEARRPRGGFSVGFRHLGEHSDRSVYNRPRLEILINLDHPVLASALRGTTVEDLPFRRLAYEIAFAEYAVAFGYALAEQDTEIPADDVLYDVRTTLNRISGEAAALYEATRTR